MSGINKLLDIKNMCRICLTRSDNMIPLNGKLDNKLDDSPLILDALENILSVEIKPEAKYPGKICLMCYGNIKISYDLKIIFNKSQAILNKYICLWNEPDTTNATDNRVESYVEQLFIKEEVTLDNSDFGETIESDASNSLSDNYESVKSNVETEDTLDDLNSKTEVLKFENEPDREKNVKVKWLEGNKFIIKNERMTPKHLFTCASCHKKFISKEKLAQHLTVCKKLMLKQIKCDYCDYKFTSLARKKFHIKMKHTSEIRCEICNDVFKNTKALAYHKTTKHNAEGKKFVCELCGKGFYLKNGLTQHMDIHSRDVSKVICPVCGKGFHYKGGLFYHMKMHRNEKNYTCSFCGRRFLNVSGLKKHIRIHTGEKPYSCPYCCRPFLSKNILDNHVKTHTGEKNKFCPYCEKGFITSYSLKVHISSHAGNEPCQFCKRSFLNSDVLKLHMKFKHNIKE